MGSDRSHATHGLFQGMLVACWAFAGGMVGAADEYTFESLAADAPLAGQDGWQAEPAEGDADVILDLSGNGTKVARHVQTDVPQLTATLARSNDAGFNFLPFEGTETKAVIQFEATGENVAMLALGRDRNGDGLLRAGDGEIGPCFGVFDRNLAIQEANLGTIYLDNFNQGGGDGNSGNDWYRLQLRMDFTAGSGDGIGSLYFKNLNQGDKSFHIVSGMVNRPLGLLGMAADAGPSRWDAMCLRLLSNGNSVPSIDNIIPNGTTLRVTGTALADGWMTISWRGGTGPYQLQRSGSLEEMSWENEGDPVEATTLQTPVSAARMFFRITQP